MGRILKPYFRVDVHNLFTAFLHLVVSHLKTLANKPLFRCQVTYLLEVPLERGKAAPV